MPPQGPVITQGWSTVYAAAQARGRGLWPVDKGKGRHITFTHSVTICTLQLQQFTKRVYSLWVTVQVHAHGLACNQTAIRTPRLSFDGPHPLNRVIIWIITQLPTPGMEG